MLTFTFAGDESGDGSFNFARGASRYFVVAVIATRDPDDLKRIMKAREIKHGFRRISVRRSQSEPLIQVADLVAGAILRRDAHRQSEAYDMIASKIKKLVEYAG